MSTNNDKTGAVASVIRPGQSAAGPPGWEERRIEKESQEAQAEQDRIHDRESSTGLAAMKEKVHKLGESLHLVEPKDPQQRTQAQMQVGHPPSRQIDRILGSTGSLILSLLTLTLHFTWHGYPRYRRNVGRFHNARRCSRRTLAPSWARASTQHTDTVDGSPPACLYFYHPIHTSHFSPS